MFRSMAALALLLFALPAHAEDPARLIDTRAGRTPKGATRVVFQMDRPVEFLAVELPQENGIELHLLSADTTEIPSDRTIRDGAVQEITFRPGNAGLVARMTGGSQRVSAKAFALTNPDRVVVDLRADEGDAASVDAASDAAGDGPQIADVPAAVRPEPKVTSPPVREVAAAHPKTTSPAKNAKHAKTQPLPEEASPAPDPVATAEQIATIFETPSAVAPTAEDDSDFSELLGWIRVLQSNVEALNYAEDEEERAKYRRSLAFLLMRRGLYGEAERALVSSLQSPGHDSTTAVADSVHLAELRLRRGDSEGASTVARAIDVPRATAYQKIRLGDVLLQTGFPALAADLLSESREQVDGEAAAHATLLLARARWDQGDAKSALAILRDLERRGGTPEESRAAAWVLLADCLAATDQVAEARSWYEKASRLSLGDEEASWVGLQLGNLARKQGRPDDAIARYRETVDRYPNTFYATQAEWFLRVAQQLQVLRAVEASRG
ncbi:MAG: tetratricopeptide repeat protein [Gemmatimonadetes bacterium]|nr:tetratricopeptide repeat protein [Gemmatimonadota bacterium]